MEDQTDREGNVADEAPQVAEFGSLSIAFDSRVLRPRAWTTAQSRWAAELLGSAPAGKVVELCAGAGQIGLLGVADSDRLLVCVDLSAVACDFARRNAAAAGMADRVEVREGSMNEVLSDDERFALVVADPPWVSRGEVARYPEDPLLAIDGGDDGLDVARMCVETARQHLHPDGILLLQVGTTDQIDVLRRHLDGTGFDVTEIREYDRGVLVRLDLN